MQDILNAPTRATPAAAPSVPRVDLYAPIHKALRSLMCDTLARVGRLDTDDAEECSATLGQLDALLALCASHIEHENVHVHPALEAREPGAAQRIAHEHEEHLQAIDDLGGEAAALKAAAAADRPLRALRLYRHLALFIADNLQHMHIEETAHNAVLWARYSDAELGALHDALVASIPPAEMMQVLRWMVPALSPAERAGMLGDMQAQMPPPAFRAVLDAVQPQLDARAWAKLAVALGIPQVAGLVDLR